MILLEAAINLQECDLGKTEQNKAAQGAIYLKSDPAMQ